MSLRIFIPRDAGALAVGADEVAAAIAARRRSARHRASRSSATARAALYWLEPLVEVETAGGRVAYGPVDAGDVDGAVRRRRPRRRRRIALRARADRRHSLAASARRG